MRIRSDKWGEGLTFLEKSKQKTFGCGFAADWRG